MGSKKETISFEYKISPNYSIYAVSGVQGGLNPHGAVTVNFFAERPPIPRKTTHEIDKDGKLSEPVVDGTDSIIRHVLFGVTLNPHTARLIANLLNEKADEYDKIIAEQTGDKEEKK